jgi:hypothetical protein
MTPPPKRIALAIAVAATIALAACAHQPDPPPPHAHATADDDLHQADGVGGATAVAAPVARWAGAVILQMFQNIKLNVDVKLDNPQTPKD